MLTTCIIIITASSLLPTVTRWKLQRTTTVTTTAVANPPLFLKPLHRSPEALQILLVYYQLQILYKIQLRLTGLLSFLVLDTLKSITPVLLQPPTNLNEQAQKHQLRIHIVQRTRRNHSQVLLLL